MASYKATLQLIANATVDRFTNYETLALDCIELAKQALATGDMSGELKKQAKDRDKATRAIATLNNALVNPAALRITGEPAQSQETQDAFARAVSDEIVRLTAAIADPERLRAIYRRGEVRAEQSV